MSKALGADQSTKRKVANPKLDEEIEVQINTIAKLRIED